MKKKILLIIITFTSSLNCFACLNGETKELKSGDMLYADYDYGLPFGHNFFNGDFEEMKFRLDSIYKKTNDIAYLSDKGLILILEKKYNEALELYLKIEKTNPNRYSTASNVGTIYELIGENKKAWDWINKSIKINPKSHNGSEWLHSKILQAKINGEKYYTSEFLLGLNFGNGENPIGQFDNLEIDRIYKSIHFQLNERISLIKPKDKIVAVLLFELGNLSILNKKFKDARELFKKSREYGLNSDLLAKRLKFVNERLNIKIITKNGNKIEITEKTDYAKTVILFLTIFLVLIGFMVFVKRKWK
jgi:tetratricopeptide (TPR) repeat protein